MDTDHYGQTHPWSSAPAAYPSGARASVVARPIRQDIRDHGLVGLTMLDGVLFADRRRWLKKGIHRADVL